MPLLEHIQAASAELEGSGADLDDETRKKALNAAKDLVAALQKPHEVVMHYSYHLGSQRMAIRVAVDMHLFRILAAANGQPVTATKLAEESKGEKLLIVRLLRVLSAIKLVTEVDHEVWAANQLTRVLAEPVAESIVKICFDNSTRIQATLHEYFKEKGYKSPVSVMDCPMQWTFNTKLNYFKYIQSDPVRLADFNAMMGRIRGTRKHWTEWYPVDSEILEGVSDDAESMVLIDMGGSKGHDLETFLKRYPQTKGRLMLQDLPPTIESITTLSDGIQKMSHDFFTPQPIKGARVYYMHFVMHDWPDDRCRDILRSIMAAMRPGYSKLLLNEVVLPDRDCPVEFAAADINMMCILAGMERSKTQWIELVESVGLEVTAVRTSPFQEDAEGVVEAVLKV